MNAVVLAGGRIGPNDPLYPLCPDRPKALLTIGSRTLVEYVVAALQPPAVAEVCVIGLPPDVQPDFGRAVHRLPDRGHMLENALQGLTWQAEQFGGGYLLVLTADIPCLTPADVDHFLERCRPLDVVAYYPFLTRAAIEVEFPNSRRTYSRFRDGEMTGGNIALLHTDMARQNPHFWRAMIEARKYPWRIARLVGLSTLLRLAFRRLSLTDVTAVATRRLGIPVRNPLVTRAALGMDVDKPHQYEQVAAWLTTAAQGSAPPAG